VTLDVDCPRLSSTRFISARQPDRRSRAPVHRRRFGNGVVAAGSAAGRPDRAPLLAIAFISVLVIGVTGGALWELSSVSDLVDPYGRTL
jgi:hypothetical protein